MDEKTTTVDPDQLADLDLQGFLKRLSLTWSNTVCSIPTATITASLEKLKSECEDVKTMVPDRQISETSELSASTEADQESDLGTVSPLDSTLVSPESSPLHESSGSRAADLGVTRQGLSHLELEDLDLLPTKEVSSKFA